MSILYFLILLPLISSILIWFFPNYSKSIALWCSSFCLPIASLLWVFFDNTLYDFQFLKEIIWIQTLNTSFSLGIDGISLYFIELTAFLIPLCILSSWHITKDKALYFRSFLLIESLILAVFSVVDLISFYVFFEAVLIPIYLLIGSFGSRNRRIKAANLFFLYTLFGSLLILIGIFFLINTTGTSDYRLLQAIILRPEREQLLWLAFFCSFAVKVPIVPVHLWLPEAHVEAPTAGSVLLAGILLKLGRYGLIRFSVGLFPLGSIYFRPFVLTLRVISILYTSLRALRQSDIKRVIAYASVAHINITLVGLFSLTREGIEGSILQIISHGIVSGGLFLSIGVLYDRYHSRLISYYSGIAHEIPIFSVIFLVFTMANIALPGSSSFIGEFLILLGIYQTNTIATVLSASSIVLGGCYSLWLFNRVMYGNIRAYLLNHKLVSDLTSRELALFIPLVFLTLLIGIYPRPFLDTLNILTLE